MGITVNTSPQQITASVGETQIDVTVSGGIGPSGAVGGSYAAASHTHAISDVTGLQTALDGKAAATHAASHAAGGADQVFNQDLNTDDNVEFARVEIAGWRLQEGNTPGDFWLAMPGYAGLFAFNTDGSMRFPDASTQTTAYTGKIGTTSGLILKTGTAGVIEALAMGTAGQVLKVNSGATGVEWGTADVDVLHDTVSSTTYTGRAAPGSATSASVWKIRRTVYSGAGAVSSTATATNVKWDDRLTASYS